MQPAAELCAKACEPMLFFVGNAAKADAKLCVLRAVKCNKRLSLSLKLVERIYPSL